jgi:glucose/arabinose dehydrogenase
VVYLGWPPQASPTLVGTVVGRRLLVILAVFMGLSVVAASIQPPPREREAASDAGRETAPSTPAPARADARAVTLSADGPRKRVMVELGRALHLEVTASKPGSVQVGQDGPIAAVQPESPARFDLLPDQPGTLEVALLDPRRVIGRITTRR